MTQVTLVVEVIDGIPVVIANQPNVRVIIADYDWPEDDYTHTLGEANEGFHRTVTIAEYSPDAFETFSAAAAL